MFQYIFQSWRCMVFSLQHQTGKYILVYKEQLFEKRNSAIFFIRQNGRGQVHGLEQLNSAGAIPKHLPSRPNYKL